MNHANRRKNSLIFKKNWNKNRNSNHKVEKGRRQRFDKNISEIKQRFF